MGWEALEARPSLGLFCLPRFPALLGRVCWLSAGLIGETMIVVMAAGVAANMTINPLEAVTTVTVQIVMLLTGDNEFDSVKTLSAFALGITLFADHVAAECCSALRVSQARAAL